MSIADWVIVAVIIAGILIALFGWDRCRGNRKSASNDSAAQPSGEVFIDPETGRWMRV